MLDLIGHIYGRLLVKAFSHRDKKSVGHWICQCTCGNQIIVIASSLRNGGTKSCGCLRLERLRKKTITHGLTHSGIYNNWYSMHSRCYDPTHKSYEYYSAKGVIVCERWHNIVNFCNDMGPKPHPTYTIDRINNQGNYEPSNCQWSSKETQIKNRSNAVLFTYLGEEHTAAVWSKRLGLNRNTIENRIRNHGWTIEEALTTPIRYKNPNGQGRKR